MQRRILIVFGMIGALAGLGLLVALWLLEPAGPVLVETVAPPPVLAEPPADGLAAVRQHGTLRGRVVNGARNDEPIAGAKVIALRPHLAPAEDDDEVPIWGELLAQDSVLTDERGTFAVEDLPPDYWNLWVEKEGFSWTTVPRAKFKEKHVIRLYPACSIRGQVVLPDGKPAPGVRIEYTPQGTHSEVFSRYRLKYYYIKTDEDGRFEYRDLPPGKFTVEVYPQNHLPAPWDREPPLKPGENRDLGIRKLDGGFGMEVHVKWRGTEEPVPDVEVVVRPMGDPMPRTKIGQRRRTDLAGVARFQGLGGQVMQKPEFLVTVNMPEGPVMPDRPGLWAPGSTITIYLRKAGSLKGKVLLASGEPLVHFGVSLKAVGHHARQLQVFGENGAFAMHQVPEGTYDLTVHSGNYINETVRVTAVPGRETDVGTIILQPGAEIFGTVARSGGQELKGLVRVNLGRKVKNPAGHDVYELVGRSYCLKDGSYSIQGIPAGTFDLWPEGLESPSHATDPTLVTIGERDGAVRRDLVLWGHGNLKLRFYDMVDDQERHVVQPVVHLVEERTNKELRWMSEGTNLRPGRYEIYVTTKNPDGVSQRYRAGTVSIQEDGVTGPMKIRLHDIRHGRPGIEEDQHRIEPKGRKGSPQR